MTLSRGIRKIQRSTPRPLTPTARAIMDGVCSRHSVTAEQIVSYGRTAHLVRARWEFMARCYATGKFSSPQVGAFLGRDHATVLYGIRKHSELEAA